MTSIRPDQAHKEYRSLLEADIEDLFSDQKNWNDRACPLCEENDFDLFVTRLNNVYVQCKSCQMVFLKKIPPEEALNRYYRKSKSASFFHENILKPTSGLRKENLFKKRLAIMVKKVSAKNRSILDMGCSIGSFVEVCSEHGWKSYGFEPNEVAAMLAKGNGLKVFENWDLLRENVPPASLGVLSAWEVLAHLAYPLKELDQAISFLKSEGLLFITTPNINSLEYQLIKESHDNFAFPFLQIFSTETIQYLMDRLKLKLLDLSTPGEMDLENIQKHFMSQNRENWPNALESLMFGNSPQQTQFRQAFQSSLVQGRLSGHMMVIAQKM